MKKMCIIFVLIIAVVFGYLEWDKKDKKQVETATVQRLQEFKKEVQKEVQREVQTKEQKMLLSETHPSLQQQIIQNGKKREVIQNVHWGMTPKETALRLVDLTGGVRTEARELIDYLDQKKNAFFAFLTTH